MISSYLSPLQNCPMTSTPTFLTAWWCFHLDDPSSPETQPGEDWNPCFFTETFHSLYTLHQGQPSHCGCSSCDHCCDALEVFCFHFPPLSLIPHKLIPTTHFLSLSMYTILLHLRYLIHITKQMHVHVWNILCELGLDVLKGVLNPCLPSVLFFLLSYSLRN